MERVVVVAALASALIAAACGGDGETPRRSCAFAPGDATYAHGATWAWDCNTCRCDDGTWTCTTMGCPPDGGAPDAVEDVAPDTLEDVAPDAVEDTAPADAPHGRDGDTDAADVAATPGDAIRVRDGVRDAAPETPPDAATRRDAAPPATACGPESPTALRLCVEEERYAADLRFVAAPRPPGSGHWQAVQDRGAGRLAALGFAVERFAYGSGVDVIGVLAGEVAPDEVVVVSAHYDHIPGCAGADDNASGVAGALEVARVLAQARYERTLVVALWDEEERGLIGAEAWAATTADRGWTVVSALVFEMIGYRDATPGAQSLPQGLGLLFPAAAARVAERGDRGDFLAIVADERSHASSVALQAHAAAIGLPTVLLEVKDALTTSPLLGDLRRSDHAAFWATDQPGTMLTDTADFRNPNYHCAGGEDAVETLDDTFAADIVRATVGAAAEVLRVR